MQDRFKFRAVDMKTKEIIYIDNYYWFEENGIAEIDNNGTASGHTGEYWINQCTGLKDKNGKLIYEGDIVEILGDEIPYVIEYDEDRARFVIDSEIDRVCCDFDNYSGYELEIIGNIYENKELLQGE